MIAMIAITNLGPRVCSEIRLRGTPTGLVFEGLFDVFENLRVLGFTVKHEHFYLETLIPPSEELVSGDKGMVQFNLEIL